MATITFRMDASKDLVATTATKIYQQESNVDSIAILLPCSYSDMDLADFKVTMRYTDFANVIHDVELEKDEEVYKESYYRYVFPITKDFTQAAGRVHFSIAVTKGSEEDGNILHTGEATVVVLPWSAYTFKEGV